MTTKMAADKETAHAFFLRGKGSLLKALILAKLYRVNLILPGLIWMFLPRGNIIHPQFISVSVAPKSHAAETVQVLENS